MVILSTDHGPVVKDLLSHSTSINHLAMVWGKFIGHGGILNQIFAFDTTECDETCDLANNGSYCHPIKISQNNPDFGTAECLSFTRSVGTCTHSNTNKLPRPQINAVTHYLDGSNIYGSSQQEAYSL